ncbi:MAG: hypothetical protein JXB49_12635, partial [Bacteroidales bacterium]|nr:hypothetical protein [Bacteroidales bacterium]
MNTKLEMKKHLESVSVVDISSNKEIGRYNLNYFPDLHDYKSVIQSVEEKYNDQTVNIYTCEYSGSVDGANFLKTDTFKNDHFQYVEHLTTSVYGDIFSFKSGEYIDLNGDGFSDYISSVEVVVDGNSSITNLARININSALVDNKQYQLPYPLFSYYYSQNWGSHRDYSVQNGQFADINGDGQIDYIYKNLVFSNTGFGWSQIGNLPETNVGGVFIDVNGDGLPDFVKSPVTYINDGLGGWKHISSYDIVAQIYHDPVLPTEKSQLGYDSIPTDLIKFVDLNGDDLLDYTVCYSEGGYRVNGSCFVSYINTGTGFTLDDRYKLPYSLYSRYPTYTANHSDFVDINGDGLKDYITSYICTTLDHAAVAVNRIWINTGMGWKEELNDSKYTFPSGVYIWYNVRHDEEDRLVVSKNGQFVDINGDGLDDFILASTSSGNSIFINSGNGWIVNGNSGFTLINNNKVFSGHEDNLYNLQYGDFVDINADGSLDFMESIASSPYSAINTHLNKRNIKTNLLTKVTKNNVTTEINYQYSLKFDKIKDAPLTDYPVVNNKVCGYLVKDVWTYTDESTVIRDSENNITSIAGNNNHIEYDYENPLFYSGTFREKQNLGFEKFIVKDANTGIKSIKWYKHKHSDGSYQGTEVYSKNYAFKPEKSETYNRYGALLSKRVYEYYDDIRSDFLYRDYKNDIKYTKFIKLKSVTDYSYIDGAVSSSVRNEIKEYDMFGNVKKSELYYNGVLDRKTELDYANDINCWIISRPSQVLTFNKNGVQISGSRFYYRGFDLEEKQSWLNTENKWIGVSYGYNDFGIVTSVKEPGNNVSTINYDPDYPLAPESAVNSLGHEVSYEYDTVFDRIKKSVDENGHDVSYKYDDQGRVIEVLYPGDEDWSVQYMLGTKFSSYFLPN